MYQHRSVAFMIVSLGCGADLWKFIPPAKHNGADLTIFRKGVRTARIKFLKQVVIQALNQTKKQRKDGKNKLW